MEHARNDDQTPRGATAAGSSGTGSLASRAEALGESGLALELTGGMPCVRCTYDLRGLSVRGVCPECGTAIRATILARVDPLAKELQPVYTPRLTAGCLVLWTIGALGAAVASWVPRVIEGLNRLDYGVRRPEWGATAVLVCGGISGLASLALVRPHARIPGWQSWAALGGAFLYVPLLFVLARIQGGIDARHPSPYLGAGGIDAGRAAWRLAADVLILGILVGLRFNARVLTSRSFVLRTGQVDRQTMVAMAAAVGVCIIGDLLAIAAGGVETGGTASAVGDALRVGAMLFIGVGSLLVTLGLAGMVMDSLRLVGVVAQAPLALSDVTRPIAEGSGSTPP